MSTAERAYRETNTRQRRDELVMSHVELVRHEMGRAVARLPQDVDRENLESAGLLALVEAAQRFDPAKGAFEAYARPRIRGAIIDELRRNSPLSQTMLQRVTAINAARQQLEPPVSVEQLAAATGLTDGQVVEALEAARLTRSDADFSLDQIPQRGSSESDNPARRVEQSELLESLTEAIAQMEDRNRLIVTMYYLEDLRLVEIADVLKLSTGHVSRLLAEAELWLSERLRSHLP